MSWERVQECIERKTVLVSCGEVVLAARKHLQVFNNTQQGFKVGRAVIGPQGLHKPRYDGNLRVVTPGWCARDVAGTTSVGRTGYHGLRST